MNKIILIIPAFNEEDSILNVCNKIKSYKGENKDINLDYIVINDGSKDNTGKICKDNNINCINLINNLGIGGAVQTGYKYAYNNGYDIAVQFDGDGQHDASYLEAMHEHMEQNKLDMVIGSRFIEKEGFQSSGLRRFGIRYFTFLIRILTSATISDPTSGMRMVNRSVMEEFVNHYPKDYPEPESVVAILDTSKKVGEYPVVMRERMQGVSSISPMKSIYYMIKVTLAIFMEKLRVKRN